MTGLPTSDLRAALDFIAEIERTTSLDAAADTVGPGVGSAVPAHLEPYLAAAHRGAELQAELAAVREGLAAAGQYYIVVGADGSVTESSPGALERLGPHLAAIPSGLAAVGATASAMAFHRDDVVLTVRVIPVGAAGDRLLLLAEHAVEPSAAALAALGLTERETEVVTLVAAGKSNAQIARALHLSPHTVKKHLERVYARVGVRSRTQLATLALRTPLPDRV